jgi:hypothetical protein
MAISKRLKVAIGIATLFCSLVGIIAVLMVKHVVSIQVALLMLVALLGLYVGFGILILVYLLISKLD